MALISADDHFAVFASVAALAAFGLLAERTSWGRALTGLVWTGGLALLLGNVGAIPQQAAAYELIKDYLVPIAIPLFLFRVNLREIFREAGKTLVAFAIGAMATVLGTFAALQLIDLGEMRAELAGVFVATYTGGTMNFAATAHALGFEDEALLSAALAADSIVGKSYLLLLALLPGFAVVRRFYGENGHRLGPPAARGQAAPAGAGIEAWRVGLALALSIGMCALGLALARLFGLAQYGILFITLLALVPGTVFPTTARKLDGSFDIGVVLAYLFFGAISAGADVSTLVEIAPTVMSFAVTIVVVHAVIVFAAGRMLGLSLGEVITASNACILGPTTAAALAAARGWQELVTPGILAGIFGYAIGTFLGVLVAGLL